MANLDDITSPEQFRWVVARNPSLRHTAAGEAELTTAFVRIRMENLDQLLEERCDRVAVCNELGRVLATFAAAAPANVMFFVGYGAWRTPGGMPSISVVYKDAATPSLKPPQSAVMLSRDAVVAAAAPTPSSTRARPPPPQGRFEAGDLLVAAKSVVDTSGMGDVREHLISQNFHVLLGGDTMAVDAALVYLSCVRKRLTTIRDGCLRQDDASGRPFGAALLIHVGNTASRYEVRIGGVTQAQLSPYCAQSMVVPA